MPKESAIAEGKEMAVSPFNSPAKTTPTAIPSGRLCMVTAKISIKVRPSRVRGPSGSSAS